ncbi:hypothetical protein [Amycolatopsis sp. NPDC052450]|uniref:hypothetical protein n=1 Tax=Amycolatopsis sp. NPDC052450 TaxID=3363937 RepID=UPI0037CB8A6A
MLLVGFSGGGVERFRFGETGPHETVPVSVTALGGLFRGSVYPRRVLDGICRQYTLDEIAVSGGILLGAFPGFTESGKHESLECGFPFV